jgi:hypothetical protein
MDNLADRIVHEIELGRMEEALEIVQALNSIGGNPSVCNRRTLDALQKARTLALVQRSHVQRKLRSLQASRLYTPRPETERRTFEIDA